MARVFITGSSDGLGRMAGELLLSQGHAVVLHARNEARAQQTHAAVPGAEHVVVGDLSSMAETRRVAEQVNALGTFDAVIHNAGVGYRSSQRVETVDGLPLEFAVNTLAHYILTALIKRPKRLIYLSSGLHQAGDPSLNDLTWKHRPWRGQQAYSDSKIARRSSGICDCPPLAQCPLERSGAGLGAHQDGGPGRSRRSRRRLPHPGVAGSERRASRESDGRVFLPSAVTQAAPGDARRCSAGETSGSVRRILGRCPSTLEAKRPFSALGAFFRFIVIACVMIYSPVHAISAIRHHRRSYSSIYSPDAGGFFRPDFSRSRTGSCHRPCE